MKNSLIVISIVAIVAIVAIFQLNNMNNSNYSSNGQSFYGQAMLRATCTDCGACDSCVNGKCVSKCSAGQACVNKVCTAQSEEEKEDARLYPDSVAIATPKGNDQYYGVTYTKRAECEGKGGIVIGKCLFLSTRYLAIKCSIPGLGNDYKIVNSKIDCGAGNCKDNGALDYCYPTKFVLPSQPPSTGCTAGFINSYQCSSDNTPQQMYQNSDCTTVWKTMDGATKCKVRCAVVNNVAGCYGSCSRKVPSASSAGYCTVIYDKDGNYKEENTYDQCSGTTAYIPAKCNADGTCSPGSSTPCATMSACTNGYCRPTASLCPNKCLNSIAYTNGVPLSSASQVNCAYKDSTCCYVTKTSCGSGKMCNLDATKCISNPCDSKQCDAYQCSGNKAYTLTKTMTGDTTCVCQPSTASTDCNGYACKTISGKMFFYASGTCSVASGCTFTNGVECLTGDCNSQGCVDPIPKAPDKQLKDVFYSTSPYYNKNIWGNLVYNYVSGKCLTSGKIYVEYQKRNLLGKFGSSLFTTISCPAKYSCKGSVCKKVS